MHCIVLAFFISRLVIVQLRTWLTLQKTMAEEDEVENQEAREHEEELAKIKVEEDEAAKKKT